MTANGSRTYLVECYVPGVDALAVEAAAGRARASATALRDEGRQVDYAGAILVRDDEVVFHLFAADDPADVREASVRARVPLARVVETVAIGEGAVV